MVDASATNAIAALLGLYFVAAGIGLLRDGKTYSAMIEDLKAQPVLAYLAGVLAFALGGTLVVVHNDWDGPLSGFVSLIGWIALIEGALLIAFRQAFMDILNRLSLTDRLIRFFSILVLALGFILIYAAIIGI